MNASKLALLIVCATAVAAVAQPGKGPDRAERMERRERMERLERMERRAPDASGPRWERLVDDQKAIRAIGLTDEQVAALKTRMAEAEKTMIRLRSEVELAEAEVRRLMREENPDRAAIMKAVEAAGAAHTALRKAQIEERLAIREILGQDGARKARKHLAKAWRDQEGADRPGPRQERARPHMGRDDD